MNRCVAYAGLLLLFAGLVQAQPNTLTPAEAKAGWILLSDGKSLTGWEALPTSAPPANGDWIAKDGALVCPGTSPGWIAYTGTGNPFSNFHLKLEFRGAAQVNSGVFLRSQKEGQPHVTGYELQIWDYQPAGYNTGSLVGSVKAAPTKILGGKWNNLDVTAQGDHFLVILNGTTLLDAHDSKHSSGMIGFQCQKDNNIEFRSIRVLPLK